MKKNRIIQVFNKIVIAKEMSFMLNLGIDGKETVKIEKRCATNPWHTLYVKDKCDFISGTPCMESRASAA